MKNESKLSLTHLKWRNKVSLIIAKTDQDISCPTWNYIYPNQFLLIVKLTPSNELAFWNNVNISLFMS